MIQLTAKLSCFLVAIDSSSHANNMFSNDDVCDAAAGGGGSCVAMMGWTRLIRCCFSFRLHEALVPQTLAVMLWEQ